MGIEFKPCNIKKESGKDDGKICMFQYEYVLKRVSVTDILPNLKKYIGGEHMQ